MSDSSSSYSEDVEDHFESDLSSSSSDEDDEVANQDISKYHFCPDHKAGSMKKDCKTCSAALSVISDPVLVNRLLSATDAGNLSRYAIRCDDVEPTLSLSPLTVELAKETFNGGKFRDRKVWRDMIEKYLTLSHSDHLKLTDDIAAEDVFNKFRGDRKYNFIFKFMSDMKVALKDLRLGQRPLFKIIESLSENLANLRKLGEDLGMEFPESAPPRKGTNVPRGGCKVPDHLDYESTANIFPCPDLSQFLADTGLSRDEGDTLAEMFEKYRKEFVEKFMDLYKSQATALTGYDDYLMFYRNIYSHVDALLKDLLRDKAASLFKPDVKSEILAKSSTLTKDANKAQCGLFGGDVKIRSALTKATKNDLVLKKAVNSTYSRSRERKNSSFNRDRSRSRSRSRSRERTRSSGSRGFQKSSSKSDYQKGKRKSSFRKPSSAKKSRTDKNKSD